jgi:hypothetical protein
MLATSSSERHDDRIRQSLNTIGENLQEIPLVLEMVEDLNSGILGMNRVVVGRPAIRLVVHCRPMAVISSWQFWILRLTLILSIAHDRFCSRRMRRSLAVLPSRLDAALNSLQQTKTSLSSERSTASPLHRLARARLNSI